MLQQSSRFLFKQAEKASRGKQCEGLFAYINKTESLCSSKSQAKTIDEFLDVEHLRTTLQTRSAACIRQVFTAMQKDTRSKKEKDNEIFALDVQKMTNIHLKYILFEMALKRVKSYRFKEKSLKVAIIQLIKLFAVNDLVKDSESLYEVGYFGAGSGALRDQALNQLLIDLRPSMIGLVEYSPNFEAAMCSTIGNKYGDIYELQLETAKKSYVNKHEIPPYYESLMKPTMGMRKPAKL